MTPNPTPLDEMLQAWGKHHHRAPEKNNTMKAKAVASLHPSASVSIRSPQFHIPRLSLALLCLAVLSIFVTPDRAAQWIYRSTPIAQSPYADKLYHRATNDGLQNSDAFGVAASEQNFEMHNEKSSFWGGPREIPLDDTRELMKVGYQATLQTRHVEQVGGRIELLIRGYGGRIDSEALGTRSGHFSFVLPKENFNPFFKGALQDLVGKKFFEEHIQMENQLPQKRVLEEQTLDVEEQTHQLHAQRDTLANRHAGTVKNLNTQLAGIRNQIKMLETKTDTEEQIAALQADIKTLEGRLQREHSNYARDLGSINAQLAYAESRQKSLAEQDQALHQTVETVSGYISIRWISIPQMIRLFLPIHWVPMICIALAILVYISSRRTKNVINLA